MELYLYAPIRLHGVVLRQRYLKCVTKTFRRPNLNSCSLVLKYSSLLFVTKFLDTPKLNVLSTKK
jgi:hypothetical protein